jgi:Acylamino-acid-releasing enzyme, N-terminal domain
MKAFSPICDTSAIIREVADPKASDNKPRQCLEIWKNGYLWNSWDFAQFEKHGRVYTDGTFGCFEFSPDAKYLVYLAEKKDPKKQSFLKVGLSQATEGMQVVSINRYTFMQYNKIIFGCCRAQSTVMLKIGVNS